MRSIRGLHVIRSGVAAPGVRAARADGDTPTDTPTDGRLATLEVDFSVFDAWYEIDSFWEGRFLERVVSGAFKRTIQRNPQPKVLFNHGYDFNIGDKILGVVELLEERPESPHLEAGLLDTAYNRELLPGLRAGGYGSSFMFEVLAESWDHEPEASDYNPNGLPERSVTEVALYEAGPVTWPANPEATAGVRSGTDWMIDTARQRDTDSCEDLTRSLAGFRATHGLRSPLDGDHATPVVPDDEATTAPDSPESPSLSRAKKQHLQWQARQRLHTDV